MGLELVPLKEGHLADAAALVCARYRGLRQRVPPLPVRYQDVAVVLPMLTNLAGRVPGVAAVQGARLVGFLLGLVLPDYQGRRSVWSPEWANGAELEESRPIYQELYTYLAPRWLANGCFAHIVSLMPHDREGLEAWFWLSFGMHAVDGLRGLSAVPRGVADPVIRRAEPDDIETVATLDEGLWRHLAGAPALVAFPGWPERPRHEGWLRDPGRVCWLASLEGETVACMVIGPAHTEACTIIQDPKTSSITGAYTREDSRGRGLATALLNQCLAWSRSEGYERCGVDFEPMNVLATRFWTQYFQSVCYSLIRQVDERLAWAHDGRKSENIW
jgi:GNAT superfamily N-acetyltransferase